MHIALVTVIDTLDYFVVCFQMFLLKAKKFKWGEMGFQN